MKRYLICLLALFVCIPTAFADPILNPKPIGLELYPNMGKYIFEVKLPENEPVPGTYTIEIPGAFDLNSIRFLERDQVGSVNIKVEQKINELDLDNIELDLKAKKLLLNSFLAQKASYEQLKKHLTSATVPSRSPTDDIISWLEETSNMRLELENKIYENEESIKVATKMVQKLEKEVQLVSPQNKDYSIKIEAVLLKPVVQFEAMTKAVSWAPAWTMDMDTKTGQVSGKLYLSTKVQTGMPYSGKINFHTQIPDNNVSTPNLRPLVVTFRPKQPKTRQRSLLKSARSNETFAGLNAMAQEDFLMEPEILEVVNTLSDRTISLNANLKGVGQPIKLVAGETSLEGSMLIELVPELSPQAYVLATLKSPPETLIPGPAELFIDGHASGSGVIPEFGLSQMKLAFGKTPLISAKKTRDIEEQSKNFFGTTTLIKDGYIIEVTNGMPTEKEIYVKDRIPKSSNELIKIETSLVSPTPSEIDENNRFTWNLKLKPGETKNIKVKWTISYPNSETLAYRS